MNKQIELEIKLADGKYTYRRYKEGGQAALRYDLPWRNLTGDNLIYYLAAEVERLRQFEDLCQNIEADGRPHGKDWQGNACECDHCAMWDRFARLFKEL